MCIITGFVAHDLVKTKKGSEVVKGPYVNGFSGVSHHQFGERLLRNNAFTSFIIKFDIVGKKNTISQKEYIRLKRFGHS